MRRDNEILAIFFRLRILLLSAIAGATFAALAALLAQSRAGDFALAWPLPAAFILALLIAHLHVRHFFLALAAALAPLPGLVWAGILAVPASQTEVLAYAFAIALCLFQAGSVADRVSQGEDGKTAAAAALAEVFVPAGLTAVMLSVILLLWFVHQPEGAGIAAAQLMFAGLSGLTVLPLAASGLNYSETFLEQFSRRREARGRVMESMAMVAVPRWGTSFAGIALVFSVLGFFGAMEMVRSTEFLCQPLLWAASAAVIFLGGYVTGGGWRSALSLLAAFITVVTCGLWALAELRVPVSASELLELHLAASSGLLAALALMAQAERNRRAGDHPLVGLLRAIEKNGIGFFYGAMAGLASLAPLAFSVPEWPALAVTILVGALAAGIFAPAFMTLSEVAFPRRRTLEEVFGKR